MLENLKHFKVWNIKLISISILEIKFVPDGIDYTIPDNKKVNETDRYIEILIYLRGCNDGEEMTPDGKCQECKPGYYLLVAPDKTELCKECIIHEKAECLGANKLYPKTGYWRSTIYSDNMIICRNEEACL